MPSLRFTDLHPLLFGETSPFFLAEVALRTALTYLGVVAIMRLLGARVAGQFTLFEVSVSVVIAAAIGVPLQSPERGLLPACVLVLVLVALQHVVAKVAQRHRPFQTAISGDVAELVTEGALQLEAMRRNAIPRETLFSQLRLAGHLNLGEVDAVFLEPSGKMTVVAAAQTRPGLCLVPACDVALRDAMSAENHRVCAECGVPDPASPCARCGGQRTTAGASRARLDAGEG